MFGILPKAWTDWEAFHWCPQWSMLAANTWKGDSFLQSKFILPNYLNEKHVTMWEEFDHALCACMQVRRKLVGKTEPSYSKYTCYTGIADFTPPDIDTVGYRVFLGNGKYFVSSDVGGGKMQWCGCSAVLCGNVY